MTMVKGGLSDSTSGLKKPHCSHLQGKFSQHKATAKRQKVPSLPTPDAEGHASCKLGMFMQLLRKGMQLGLQRHMYKQNGEGRHHA
jgi:hypothetical protein